MRNRYIIRLFIFAIAVLFFTNPVAAQSTSVAGSMNGFLYGILAFLLLAITYAVHFVLQNNKYQKEANIKAGKPNAPTGLAKWWKEMDARFFTKAAPLEKEQDVLLDHNYDGIKELDNALPPWWKWGFYITIVLGVIYMFRFHVWKTGPTPLEEYNKEMMVAETQLEIFRKSNSEAVDEKTVKMADAKGIDAGKAIFTKTCTPCHGVNGEGNAVGPNLTDKYWLHGGSISNVFRTINLGVPDKGMQAWGKSYSSGEIKNLASFVLSLQGSKPANAKAPQGNEYIPGIKIDSSAVKKDSVAIPVQGK
jgi:cytochrome c oxidase cbb3-type subunit 3